MAATPSSRDVARDRSSGRILIVEDNEIERKSLARVLRSEGFSVHEADSTDKAMSYTDEEIDIILSDLRMQENTGLDLLKFWKSHRPETIFIMLTGDETVRSAVEAMKAGAYDYLTKPVNHDELLVVLNRALESVRKDRELESLRRRLDERFGLDRFIGQSEPMQAVFQKIRRAAPVDSTVLILGESGTGKELVAQALHQNSARKNGPFVAVNCAAVPATLVESELFGHVRGAFTGATDRRIGRFEQANGGTLFIDEIGDFELGLQAKLLRVLETHTLTPVGGHEERKVNVRVVAATSRNIQKMLADGAFREDLYYRLNVITISLPPLRERLDDLPLLVDFFVKDLSESRGMPHRHVEPAVMKRFQEYHWPGNVRELRNMLESMMVLATGPALSEADLPERILQPLGQSPAGTSVPGGLTMDELEKQAILNALSRHGDNRTHAARALGVSVRTLQRKLLQYGLRSAAEASPTDEAVGESQGSHPGEDASGGSGQADDPLISSPPAPAPGADAPPAGETNPDA